MWHQLIKYNKNLKTSSWFQKEIRGNKEGHPPPNFTFLKELVENSNPWFLTGPLRRVKEKERNALQCVPPFPPDPGKMFSILKCFYMMQHTCIALIESFKESLPLFLLRVSIIENGDIDIADFTFKAYISNTFFCHLLHDLGGYCPHSAPRP